MQQRWLKFLGPCHLCKGAGLSSELCPVTTLGIANICVGGGGLGGREGEERLYELVGKRSVSFSLPFQ